MQTIFIVREFYKTFLFLGFIMKNLFNKTVVLSVAILFSTPVSASKTQPKNNQQSQTTNALQKTEKLNAKTDDLDSDYKNNQDDDKIDPEIAKKIRELLTQHRPNMNQIEWMNKNESEQCENLEKK